MSTRLNPSNLIAALKCAIISVHAGSGHEIADLIGATTGGETHKSIDERGDDRPVVAALVRARKRGVLPTMENNARP